MAETSSKKKWYLRWWAFILYVFVFLIIAGSIGGNSSKPTSDNQQDKQDVQVVTGSPAAQEPTSFVPDIAETTTVPEAPQPPELKYSVVDQWDIPNGGQGQVIVISHDLVNETDMVRLGEKIKLDYQKDRNAFISVFDDLQAAKLRDKVLADKASASEQTLYDQHFVGQYNKNANTGFHKFNIYLDGVSGNNTKTIDY